jgi:Domain of unknown function (DUF6468)
MDLLMNGLLTAATLFAGGYCWVLGRRVRDLKSLDKGLGGAIVTLTRQIELARTTLDEAKASSRDTREDLAKLVSKADGAAAQLRLLIAAAPGVPAPVVAPAPPAPPPPAPVVAAPVAPAPVAAAPAAPEPAPVPHIRAVPDPEPEVEEPPVAQPPVLNLAEVPKPRALAPIENPLRRRDDPDAPQASEDDILEALSALAGGR